MALQCLCWKLGCLMPGSNTAGIQSCLTVCASKDAVILFQICKYHCVVKDWCSGPLGEGGEEQDCFSLCSVIFASGFYHTVICMGFDGLLGSDCGEGVSFPICSEAWGIPSEAEQQLLGPHLVFPIVSVPLIDCIPPSGWYLSDKTRKAVSGSTRMGHYVYVSYWVGTLRCESLTSAKAFQD